MKEKMSDKADTGPFLSWASGIIQSDISPKLVRSSNHSSVFELNTAHGRKFLKIDKDLEPEYEKMKLLQDKLPVPSIVAFTTKEGQGGLLTAGLEGTDLAALSGILSPEEIVSKLTGALKKIHSFDIALWPNSEQEPGKTLIHGDACLPNFIYKEDGTLSGFVDIGAMRLGDVKDDLSAAVWSLQFNLGPGYGLKLLNEYGVEGANESVVEELRLAYEVDVLGSMLPEWK